jgi:hypothetical protein
MKRHRWATAGSVLALAAAACASPAPGPPTAPPLAPIEAAATASAPATTPTASAAPVASAPASGAAALNTGLLRDKPVRFTSVLAYSTGTSAIQLELASYPRTCDDLKASLADNGHSVPEGAVEARVRLAPLLATSGTMSWAVTGVYLFDVSRNSKVSDALVEGDPGSKVRTTFAFQLPEYHFAVDGPFEAAGCGVIPEPGEPAAEPQRGIKMSVAGKEFEVRGAIVEKCWDLVCLKLSTSALTCEREGLPDVLFSLNVPPKKGPARGAYALSGAVIGSNATLNTLGPSAERFDVKVSGPLKGKGNVAVELSGEVSLFERTVKLEGKVRALKCLD